MGFPSPWNIVPTPACQYIFEIKRNHGVRGKEAVWGRSDEEKLQRLKGSSGEKKFKNTNTNINFFTF